MTGRRRRPRGVLPSWLVVVEPSPRRLARADLTVQIEPGWQQAAACASSNLDPDDWFAQSGSRAHTAAKAIRGTCPVRRSCLAHALAHAEPAGIWGGADETERAQLRHALAEGVAVAVLLGPQPGKAVA
jgi:WhiB family transcriptional regulator, redox-sensing transcriptional regulator